MSILTVWRKMVDPTQQGELCEVVFLYEIWNHVIRKHVCNLEEPWDLWLSSDLANRLRAMIAGAQSLAEEHREALLDASAVVEKDVRLCLARPLMLVYRRSEKGKTFSWGVKTWELVLHEGASLIIRWNGQRGLVRTCFFGGKLTEWWPPGRRWIGLGRKLLRRYCEKTSEGLVLPKKSEVFEREDRETGAKARHTRVTFVTPKSWGFGGDNTEGLWGGRLKDRTPPAPATAQVYPKLRSRVWYEVEHV